MKDQTSYLPPFPINAPWMHAHDKEVLRKWCLDAIEADRKLTAKQLSAYESLVASLEAKCTHMRKMYDELKDRTNPDLLASERAANAILTAELEADRKRRGEPVAVIRYERNTHGRENEMPRVISCNRLPDGDYPVFTAPQPAEPSRSEPVKVPSDDDWKTLALWLDRRRGYPTVMISGGVAGDIADLLARYGKPEQPLYAGPVNNK